MELQYSFLYSQASKRALDKLAGADFDSKTAYTISKLTEKLEQQFTLLKVEFNQALKEFAELDENGKLIEPDGLGSFKIKDGMFEKWNEAVSILMSKKFTIEKLSKINIDSLINCPNLKMSSLDFQALEPILEGIDFIS